MTERQDRWRQAAETEARRGNDFAATVFAFIAQPNSAERKAAEAKPLPSPSTGS